jgi:transcriptional regulator with XRE-family HTH domain
MALPDTFFRQWRKRLRLSQQQAAVELGYGKRRIEAYDRGEEHPPKVVRLAMLAVEGGLHKEAA